LTLVVPDHPADTPCLGVVAPDGDHLLHHAG
jgi:hypothetical protein